MHVLSATKSRMGYDVAVRATALVASWREGASRSGRRVAGSESKQASNVNNTHDHHHHRAMT